MKLFGALPSAIGTVLLVLSTGLNAATVESVRAWLAPDNTRIVFDMTGPAEHSLFTLDNPKRVVIDISDTQLQADLGAVDLKSGPVERIRSGRKDDRLRIVLDMNETVLPSSFSLPPNDQYGHRLVVDLGRQTENRFENVRAPLTLPDSERDIVIAIDAGHGGEDPGAIGPGRLYEKHVVFSISKIVAEHINAEPGFRAVLIRSGDYYVPLRERTMRARQANADLFVSVHADAALNSRARGASVWTLSNRGASSEMGRWLAQRENSADLIGGAGEGVSLDDKTEDLATVLLDMSMESARRSSEDAAKMVHKKIARFARMHKNYIEKAGFAVLKSPDIPSMLVETGFISNPAEAKKLSQSDYQKQLGRAIAEGVFTYFWQKPPPGTLVAKLKDQGKEPPGLERSYRVVAGDTLSTIALRNGVSVAQLRSANQLSNDRIRVGQLLKIPAG